MSRSRWTVVAVAAAAALSLAVGSLAWACTGLLGQIYWGDTGTTEARSYSSGASISAYATGTRKGGRYNLVTAYQNDPDGHICMTVRATLASGVKADRKTGAIATQTATVPADPGTWDMCYRETTGATSTAGIVLTIL